MASFCFMPRDSSPGSLSTLSASSSSSSRVRANGFEIGDVVDARDEVQMLPDGEVIEQARFIGEKGELAFRLDRVFAARSWPQMRTVPRVGGMMPARQRSVVVLPAPLGPTRPSTSPGCRRTKVRSRP